MGRSYLLQSMGAAVADGTLIFGGSATGLDTSLGSVLPMLVLTTIQIAELPGEMQDMAQDGATLPCCRGKRPQPQGGLESASELMRNEPRGGSAALPKRYRSKRQPTRSSPRSPWRDVGCDRASAGAVEVQWPALPRAVAPIEHIGAKPAQARAAFRGSDPLGGHTRPTSASRRCSSPIRRAGGGSRRPLRPVPAGPAAVAPTSRRTGPNG